MTAGLRLPRALVGRRQLRCAVGAVVGALTLTMAVTGHVRAAAFDIAMAGVTLAVARGIRSRVDPEFGDTLALGALGLHWMIVGGLQVVLALRGHSPLLIPDETAYHTFATDQSRAWLGTGPPVPSREVFLEEPFSILLALAYVVGGITPYVGLAIPIAFGTWTCVLVHRAASHHLQPLGARTARLAGGLSLFYPTMLAWSGVLLKDSMVMFFTTAVMSGMLGLSAMARGADGAVGERRPPLPYLDIGLAIVAVVAVVTLRAAQLVPIAAGSLAWLLWRIWPRLRWRIAAIAALGLAAAAVTAVPSLRARTDQIPRSLAHHREVGRVLARTAEPPERPASEATWGSTAAHLPVGLVLVLFRPYPTEVENSSQLAGAAGNVLYLMLCIAAALGVAAGVRRGLQAEMVLLSVTVVMTWVTLGLAEGNAGTTWRHRDAATPLAVILAASVLSQVGSKQRRAR